MKNENEFNADELLARVEAFAKHTTGEKKMTLRTVELPLPEPLAPMAARQVAALRQRLGVSQAVFAILLNVPKSTAISWERGVRQPSGAALKLLRLADNRPGVLLETDAVPAGK
jgi:putative transcriptional regulator